MRKALRLARRHSEQNPGAVSTENCRLQQRQDLACRQGPMRRGLRIAIGGIPSGPRVADRQSRVSPQDRCAKDCVSPGGIPIGTPGAVSTENCRPQPRAGSGVIAAGFASSYVQQASRRKMGCKRGWGLHEDHGRVGQTAGHLQRCAILCASVPGRHATSYRWCGPPVLSGDGASVPIGNAHLRRAQVAGHEAPDVPAISPACRLPWMGLAKGVLLMRVPAVPIWNKVFHISRVCEAQHAARNHR